jgi:hypothetical protein
VLTAPADLDESTLAGALPGWDVKDLAYGAAGFFRPHSGSEDDVKSWRLLNSLVQRASELPDAYRGACSG